MKLSCRIISFCGTSQCEKRIRRVYIYVCVYVCMCMFLVSLSLCFSLSLCLFVCVYVCVFFKKKHAYSSPSFSFFLLLCPRD